MRLDVDGLCHRTLRILADQPSDYEAMRDVLGITGRTRSRFHYAINAWVDAWLICSRNGIYYLRKCGAEALAELDSGREWVCHAQAGPTVRTFNYQPKERASA
jgi:hypothetical protein